MEDQGNSRTKEATKRLSIHSSKSDSDRISSQFSLSIIDNHLESLENRHEKSVKRISKAQCLFSRSIENGLSSLSGINSIKEKFLLSLNTSSLYNDLHNIQTLPLLLLQIESISSYEYCQILIHEKGKSLAQSYSSDSQSVEIPVESFNHSFNAIRKSKMKLFKKTDDLFTNIESLGTFIAKDFSLKRHSVILVFSSNSFLPASKEELQSFEGLTHYFKPVIESLLLRTKTNKKLEAIIQSFDHLPYPMAIMNQSDEILFSNSSFDRTMLRECDQIIESQLFGKHKVLSILAPRDRQHFDIYHYERVSLLGELLNTLRHELSNPLFGLSLATELLKAEDYEDSDTEETLGQVLSNAQRCQAIIKNFSSLYMDESGFGQFNLKSIIEEGLILTKSESRGLVKKVNYQNWEDSPIMIKSNDTWITQILFNLIINSSQALKEYKGVREEEKSILINVQKERNHWVIDVKDNGPGITPQNITQIFTPFFTTKNKGTGLGLGICRDLANKLGGDLVLKESSVGSGTVFSLKIPVQS